MIEKQKIIALVDGLLAGTDMFCVDVKVSKDNQIIVVIDGDTDVAIATCVSLSRAFEKELDRDVEDFSLEVTTAGFTNPFQVFRQYKKNIGRPVEVFTKDSKRRQGYLRDAVENSGIKLELADFGERRKGQKKKKQETTIVDIKFNEINMTKGIVTF
jgi:ribosome maturation factor RimP